MFNLNKDLITVNDLRFLVSSDCKLDKLTSDIFKEVDLDSELKKSLINGDFYCNNPRPDIRFKDYVIKEFSR